MINESDYYRTFWFLISPTIEQVLFIGVLLRTVHLALHKVEQSITIKDKKHLIANLRYRYLCSVLFIVPGISALSAFLFWNGSKYSLFPGTSLFFLLVDLDVLILIADLPSNSIRNRRSSSSTKLLHSQSWKQPIITRYWSPIFHSLYFREKFTKLCLKLLLLGVGASSGYADFELIISVSLIQYLIFTFLLFLLLFRGGFQSDIILRLLHGKYFHKAPTNQASSQSLTLFTATYPERMPVKLSSVLGTTELLPSSSPHMRYVFVLSLVAVVFRHRAAWSKILNSIVVGIQDPFGQPVNSTASIPHDRYKGSEVFNIWLIILSIALCYYRGKLLGWKRGVLQNLGFASDETTFYEFATSLKTHIPVGSCKPHHNSESSAYSSVAMQTDKMIHFHKTYHAPTRTRHASHLDYSSESAVSISDMDLLSRLASGKLKSRELEALVENPARAVELRRVDLSRILSTPHVLERLPYRDYDYRFAHGQCCEEIIGYLPIPVGKVGPLLLDGRSHYIPLATTEGCLVASTNRGCRALFLSGGVKSVVYRDQMTRAPVVWFPSVVQVVKCIAWIESDVGFQLLKSAFDQTSSYADLLSVFPNPSGHYLHIRFAARTGDAMGMNMVSKATDSSLHELCRHFPDMRVISLSGNMCTDKKSAAINTILGRGKSVIAEACLPATVLAHVLHTTPARLARLAMAKNWTGSAMAGCSSMAGSNAHAANVVAGIFAATGQDLAQIVDAAACMSQFTQSDDGLSLTVTVTMPCLEVGTVGGGTRLPAQRACLDLLDLCVDRPTEHLARLIAGAVLAGELSLMAALDTDDLVAAHMRLNRAKPTAPEPEGKTEQDLQQAVYTIHPTSKLEPPHPLM